MHATAIRDQIVNMQPSATVSHQIMHCGSPEEQFHSFSTIGEEELYTLVLSTRVITFQTLHVTIGKYHQETRG